MNRPTPALRARTSILVLTLLVPTAGASLAAPVAVPVPVPIPATLQEPDPEPPREREPRPRLRPELPPAGPEAGSGAGAAQEEMLELFRKVEVRLREIDALLVDAGAGDTRRLREAGPAGIDRLIQRSLEDGRQNLRDIDRIIEIAQQHGAQRQSSSSGREPQDGQEGRDGSPTQRGQQSTQRESTPEGPGGREPDEPEPGGEQPAGEEPGDEPGDTSPQGEEQPQAGGPSPADDARNRPGDDPPASTRGAPGQLGDESERWGDLPVKVRDVFRHEGSEDLPPQYRDWIDAYYRRLQQQERRR